MKVLIYDLGFNVLCLVFVMKLFIKMSLLLVVIRFFFIFVFVFYCDVFYLDYLSEIVQLFEVLENCSVSDSLFVMLNVDQE